MLLLFGHVEDHFQLGLVVLQVLVGLLDLFVLLCQNLFLLVCQGLKVLVVLFQNVPLFFDGLPFGSLFVESHLFLFQFLVTLAQLDGQF